MSIISYLALPNSCWLERSIAIDRSRSIDRYRSRQAAASAAVSGRSTLAQTRGGARRGDDNRLAVGLIVVKTQRSVRAPRQVASQHLIRDYSDRTRRSDAILLPNLEVAHQKDADRHAVRHDHEVLRGYLGREDERDTAVTRRVVTIMTRHAIVTHTPAATDGRTTVRVRAGGANNTPARRVARATGGTLTRGRKRPHPTRRSGSGTRTCRTLAR